MKRPPSKLLTMLTVIGITSGVIGAIAYSGRNPQIGLVVVEDSVWGRTELNILVAPDNTTYASATSFGRIGLSDRGSLAKTHKFLVAPADTERLRALSEQSALFTGQVWGNDPRGLDGTLITLQYSEDSKIVTLTCTGNESFNSGARKELISLLESIVDKSYDTKIPPNKPLQPIAPKDADPVEK